MDIPKGADIAFNWFRKEDYERFREMDPDRAKMHKTYEEWLATAADLEKKIKREGGRLHRVSIDPEAFAAWCRENGLEPDSMARSQYAGELYMKEKFKDQDAGAGRKGK